MSKYQHKETGDVDTREGWITSYDAEELEARGLSAEAAFEADEGNTLIEIDETLPLDGNNMTWRVSKILKRELRINEQGYFEIDAAQFATITEDNQQQLTSRCLEAHEQGSTEYEGPAILQTSLGKVRIVLSYMFDEDEVEEAGEDEGNLPWDFDHARRCRVAGW